MGSSPTHGVAPRLSDDEVAALLQKSASTCEPDALKEVIRHLVLERRHLYNRLRNLDAKLKVVLDMSPAPPAPGPARRLSLPFLSRLHGHDTERLQRRIDALETERNSLIERLEQAESAAAEAMSQLGELDRSANTHAQAELQAMRDSLQHEVEQLQQLLQNAQHETEGLRKRLQERDTELELFQANSDALQQELDVLRSSENVSEDMVLLRDAALADLRIVEQERDEARESLTHANRVREEAVAERNALVLERDDAVHDRDVTARQRDDIAAKLQEAMSTESKAAIERDEALAARSEALEQRAAALDAEEAARCAAEAAETRLNDALEIRDVALDERDLAIRDRDKALAANTEAAAQRDAALLEREQAIRDRDVAQAERSAAFVLRDEAHQVRDDAIRLRDSAQEDLQETRRINQRLSLVLRDMRLLLRGSQAERDELRGRLRASERQVSHLEAERHNLEMARARLAEEVAAQASLASRHQQDIEELTQARDALQQSNVELMDKIRGYRNELDISEQALRELHTLAANLTLRIPPAEGETISPRQTVKLVHDAFEQYVKKVNELLTKRNRESEPPRRNFFSL